MFDLHNLSSHFNIKCLSAINDNGWFWYRRLGHAQFDLISKLSKNELVIGLLKIIFEKDKLCDASHIGKQTTISFKFKNIVSTTKLLQLLHIDLFGPSRTLSLGGKSYAHVYVDDYTSFTWYYF